MKTWKKRLALYLAVLMVLPAVVGILPGSAQEAQAATSYELYWQGGTTSGSTKTTIQVEAGQKFYIGDLIRAYTKNWDTTTGSLLKMTYKTSRSAVASVNKSTGLVTTKKAGTATIAVTYGKKTMRCTLKVVKKGALKSTSTYKSLNKAANAMADAVPTEITAKKAVKVIKAISAFRVAIEKRTTPPFVNYQGFKVDKNYNVTNELVVPMAGRFATLDDMFQQFTGGCYPLTGSSHMFKLSGASASASKNTVTVTLKSKASLKQIVSLQYYGWYYTKLDNTVANRAQFTTSITDLTAKKTYTAIGTVKTGSKTITYKLYNMSYSKSGAQVWKNVRVVKGHKYQIGSKSSWAKAKKITAK